MAAYCVEIHRNYSASIVVYLSVWTFSTPFPLKEGVSTTETTVYIFSVEFWSSFFFRSIRTRIRCSTLRIPRLHTALFSFGSIRTSFVPIVAIAKFLIALMARGARFLNCLNERTNEPVRYRTSEENATASSQIQETGHEKPENQMRGPRGTAQGAQFPPANYREPAKSQQHTLREATSSDGHSSQWT